jgi:SAM-dependent methyltransferase
LLATTSERCIVRHREFMDQPYIREFVASLPRRCIPSSGLYGFVVRLETEQDIRIATLLNRNYFRLVWGLMDDATNNHLQPDEEQVLEAVLDCRDHCGHVLEVGCGSGRLTKHLVKLTKRLTAIDSDRLVIARCRTALQEERATNVAVICENLASLRSESDFTVILMMENILGMTLQRSVRQSIYLNLTRLLRGYGKLVLSVRECDVHATPDRDLVQVMPYDPEPTDSGSIIGFGFARILRMKEILTELSIYAPAFSVERIFEGGPRPAGGSMHTAVLVKSPVGDLNRARH